MPEETFYIAQHPLLITNAPGEIPSTTKVSKGQRFALDGTEQVDVVRMLRQGAMKPDLGTPEEQAFVEEQREERAETTTKRRLKKPKPDAVQEAE